MAGRGRFDIITTNRTMRIFSPNSGGGGRMHRDMDETIQGWPYEPQPGEVLAASSAPATAGWSSRSGSSWACSSSRSSAAPTGRARTGSRRSSTTSANGPRAEVRRRGARPPRGGWTPSTASRPTVSSSSIIIAGSPGWRSHRFDMALLDADHTLALMDFVRRHGIDDEYIASHERFQGLVLFQRTQAAAALALERRRPEEAIDAIHEGVAQLAALQNAAPGEPDQGEPSHQTLIEQLRNSEQEIRKNFAVEKTLREQLDEAVAVEDYERAARIRDQIRALRDVEARLGADSASKAPQHVSPGSRDERSETTLHARRVRCADRDGNHDGCRSREPGQGWLARVSVPSFMCSRWFIDTFLGIFFANSCVIFAGDLQIARQSSNFKLICNTEMSTFTC